jgi:hypothetical protein
MKAMRTMFIGVSLFLTTSCAFQAPPVSLTAVPDQQTAIIYGRFTVGADYNMGNRLVLWLKSLDAGQSVYIYFDEKHPLQAIRVKPGVYQVKGFAGTDGMHKIIGRRVFPNTGLMGKIVKPFKVPAGSEVYVGDFTGSATLSLYQEWTLDSFTNDFAGTTVEFREKYPNLVSVPAISMFEIQSVAY